ncbi:hypothetical protein VIBNIFTn2_120126 [Vibrio nigripulchritudo FTn2]|uniref:hypothetical protein n=1 Tax=Vibrio nigripulchritudo TaxID=28173 RepID=UPI0003B1B60D|nr:hypothetical protein [Vibrio nigripulchritudo]CCN40144.1 hypothetical protein VIBNIFTn2_120126 [Vibrio nigripulchritudo FTn2]
MELSTRKDELKKEALHLFVFSLVSYMGFIATLITGSFLASFVLFTTCAYCFYLGLGKVFFEVGRQEYGITASKKVCPCAEKGDTHS